MFFLPCKPEQWHSLSCWDLSGLNWQNIPVTKATVISTANCICSKRQTQVRKTTEYPQQLGDARFMFSVQHNHETLSSTALSDRKKVPLAVSTLQEHRALSATIFKYSTTQSKSFGRPLKYIFQLLSYFLSCHHLHPAPTQPNSTGRLAPQLSPWRGIPLYVDAARTNLSGTWSFRPLLFKLVQNTH